MLQRQAAVDLLVMTRAEDTVATQTFVTPTVDPEMYGRGFVLLRVAFAVPAPFLILDLCLKAAEWFGPSGAIALFLVAFVQFRQLSLLQNKHFHNAERARKNESIQVLSEPYRKLELMSFWAGLYGAAVWAYGDKLVKVLLAATSA